MSDLNEALPSTATPLAVAWQQLCSRYPWTPEATALARLGQLGQIFARLPYENLSKIIETLDHPGQARSAAQLIGDHLRLGTGGTCFALTSCWLEVLQMLGWQVQPILADRSYGPDTHCALLIWVEQLPYLLDPGYLITDPVPLTFAARHRVTLTWQELILQRQEGDRIDLFTSHQGHKKYRLTYKIEPVDRGQFNQRWRDSYAWEMMRYPVLTQVTSQGQIYLQKKRLLLRNHGSSQSLEIHPQQLDVQIAEYFKLDQIVVHRALSHLKRKGE